MTVETKQPIRVLHVCSILQDYPVLLPVPPIAGGAPWWNVYRLHEALVEMNGSPLETTVISACEHDQLNALQSFSKKANYRWVSVRSFERAISSYLRRSSKYSDAIARRLLKTNTWLTWRYLRQVRRIWERESFDLLILDDAPQNLLYLSQFVPKEQLVFLFRGSIGMSRRYLNRCGMIIATNTNLVEYIKYNLPNTNPQPRIEVVPNSLGPEFNINRRKGSKDFSGDIRLVFAGRLVSDKGVLELVKAIELVQNQFPNVQLKLVGSSGYGNKTLTEYERAVRRAASKLPPNTVQFTGYVSYDDMPEQFLDADIAIFPSIWVEGFGMVALEAMRCGLPIIVSDRPGFKSFVRHKKNGLILDDPEDIDELASKIIHLIKNPELASKMAAEGYRTSLEYTPDSAARRYNTVVKNYLSSALSGSSKSQGEIG